MAVTADPDVPLPRRYIDVFLPYGDTLPASGHRFTDEEEAAIAAAARVQ